MVGFPILRYGTDRVAFSRDYELIDNTKEGFFLRKYDIVPIGSLLC